MKKAGWMPTKVPRGTKGRTEKDANAEKQESKREKTKMDEKPKE